MNLAKKLGRDYSAEVRTRGSGYFWQGRVKILRGSDLDQAVCATVQGTRKYNVALTYDAGLVRCSCDCEYFDSNGPCKHLWATILEIDRQGYLSKAAVPSLVGDYGQGILADDPENGGSSNLELLDTPLSPKPAPPVWKRQIDQLLSNPSTIGRPVEQWPAKRELLYVVDAATSASSGTLFLRLLCRERKLNGSFSGVMGAKMTRRQIPALPLVEDRDIISALTGGQQYYGSGYLIGNTDQVPGTYLVPPGLAAVVLPMAARSGRLFLQSGGEGLMRLTWDEAGPWEFGMDLQRARAGFLLGGEFLRGEERLDVTDPLLVTKSGFLFTRDRVGTIAEGTRLEWIDHFRKMGQIYVTDADREELLSELLCSPGLPALKVPSELRYEEVECSPRPVFKINGIDRVQDKGRLKGELSFDYEGRNVAENRMLRGFYDRDSRRFLRRDMVAENAAAQYLEELGLKHQLSSNTKSNWDLPASKLPRIVRTLVEAGWHIEADGKMFRRPGALHMEVASGVDWFELHGSVEYGELSAKAA